MSTTAEETYEGEVRKIQKAWRAFHQNRDKAFEESVERLKKREAIQREVNAKIMERLDEGWYECAEDFGVVAHSVSCGESLDKAYKSFNEVVKGILKMKDIETMRYNLRVAKEIQEIFNRRYEKPDNYPNPVITRINLAVQTRAECGMFAQVSEEEPKEEEVPHIPYAIRNVFENYYDDELKDFQESVEDDWSEEIFKRKFENHMVYSLLVMRFGEEYTNREMNDLWDHQCKQWEYNSD